MKRTSAGILADPVVYCDEPEHRVLNLRPDGVSCIPLLGLADFRMVRAGTLAHVHPGCVEIVLCRRGSMMFEADGQEYPFLPGRVFVSGPDQPHRMCNNPKGLLLNHLLFRIPRKGERILGLTTRESGWLVHALTHFPVRLFPGTERLKVAFDRLFALYDGEKSDITARKLKMKSAALELLLALVEAPALPASSKGRPNAKVRAIVARLRAAPETDCPVEELAREAALASVAFTEAFKRETGLPPHAFILDTRIRAARRELTRPGATVAAVAKKYRFSSPQHFATMFRSILGISPREAMRGA